MSPKARWASLIVGVLVFVAGFILVTTDTAEAKANTRPCIVASEFSQIELGMTRKAVYDLLDGPGKRGERSNHRVWRICDKYDNPYMIYAKATVVFNQKDRVKDGWWLVIVGGPVTYDPADDITLPENQEPVPPDVVVCYDAENNEKECNFRTFL